MAQIADILYGKIDVSAVRPLLKCPAVSRLSDISLSVLPETFTGMKMASRLEHSIGVCGLAQIACKKCPKLDKIPNLLQAAALLHDAGSPPFSHLSEIFMKEVFGKTHEENVDFALNSLKEPLSKMGLSQKEVEEAINGGLFGALNGGKEEIDLDNLDNTLRYGIYTGQIDPKKLPYSPEFLAGSAILKGRRWQIPNGSKEVISQIQEYHKVRQKVYNEFVYSDFNLSKSAFLFNALFLAFRNEELGKRFFSLTDTKAVSYLLENCSQNTSKIIRRLLEKKEVFKYFEVWTKEPSARLKSVCQNPLKAGKVCEEICGDFGIKPYELAVYGTKSSACKGDASPEYILKVFGEPGLNLNHSKLGQYF
jgi:HD superfamily phosphohydrolase